MMTWYNVELLCCDNGPDSHHHRDICNAPITVKNHVGCCIVSDRGVCSVECFTGFLMFFSGLVVATGAVV